MTCTFATRPTEHTARKAHTCDWCGTEIKAAERYANWCWFENGTATTVRSHLDCLDAASRDYPEAWFNRDQPRGCDCGFDKSCCGNQT